MITKITMNQVASYKSLTTLETNKKVNLIYGLNGTGKSVLSNFLYKPTHLDFSHCSVEGPNSDEDVLVYNQAFIDDNFYVSETLKGIFTLSKENKEAEENIGKAEQEIQSLEMQRQKFTDAITHLENDLAQRKLGAENKTWEIKETFTGGDRVLDYCLTGFKNNRSTLFTYLASIPKPLEKPPVTTEQLEKEVEAIEGSTAQEYSLLPSIKFSGQATESNPLFHKAIIGNENSTVAELIKRLGNSDWVKKGLEFIPERIEGEGEPCPFCQERTITNSLIEKIRGYFDETYANEISEIQKHQSDYESEMDSIPKSAVYGSNPYLIGRRAEYENLFGAITLSLNANRARMAEKLETPSKVVSLSSSAGAINAFNEFIDDINKSITKHNKRIENKDTALADVRKSFWLIMRWNYDQTISIYQNDRDAIGKKIRDLENAMSDVQTRIDKQREIIADQQKKTVNIDEAIANINNGLLGLGIDSFRIERHSDRLYKIVRDGSSENTFHTLSEGEQMIISFLYFIELCKGRQEASETTTSKIIVIDDPISSLSHIYVFNVGQLIYSNFTNPRSKYEQVFILTHSLYFFYELAARDQERRKKYQNLFRIVRNENGSEFLAMEYNELQNDYQSYWEVVKDQTQSPALIANCMRNIIEYFFGFIEKRNLNEVFQKETFKANKYQAFCRYMNRESHSDAQNIFDMKEFNYADFRDAFMLVFEESKYAEHYKRMMG